MGEATARVETTARGVEGANANVDDAKRQMAARMAMIFFMLIESSLRVSDERDEKELVSYECEASDC